MEYKELDINDVELDLNNPRIKQWLEIYKDQEITSEHIALALSASSGTSNTSTYTALKESIRVNKGIISPIIVNKYPDGRLVVIEGNTRLQIYKEFKKVDPEGPWGKIIAIVYDNLPETEIHAIRLQSHLVGPRDWDAFSKAKYLNQLCNIDKLPMSMIVSFCGGKSSEIRKLVDAYSDMVNYYFPVAEEEGMDADPREFSKFAELQNGSIIQSLIVHKYSKDDFAKWVVKGNVDTAQNVRKIPAILASPKAKEVFLQENISEAIKHLGLGEKSTKGLKDASFNDLVSELIHRCRNIDWQYIKSLRDDPRYDGEKQDIDELKTELEDILEEVDRD
ncbi:ParB-like nuclease [Lachnospiraceae bacterium JC7]|nr:ParB-like nuclease [Lachnospiraceae bacterium JC7]